MTCRRFVFACGVLLSLLFATTMSAQSRRAAADPISGTWTGELVPPGARGPIRITMTLKFDRILLVLEGMVVKGTATGRIAGDVTGDFKIAKNTPR